MSYVEFVLLVAGIGSALVLTLGRLDSFITRRRFRRTVKANQEEWS